MKEKNLDNMIQMAMTKEDMIATRDLLENLMSQLTMSCEILMHLYDMTGVMLMDKEKEEARKKEETMQEEENKEYTVELLKMVFRGLKEMFEETEA